MFSEPGKRFSYKLYREVKEEYQLEKTFQIIECSHRHSGVGTDHPVILKQAKIRTKAVPTGGLITISLSQCTIYRLTVQ